MSLQKVLIIATVQSHIAQFHLPLINMLKANGYKVDIAARNNLKEKNGLKIENVDNIFDIPFSRNPISINNIKSYKKIKKIVTENKYDIIHCNTPVGGVIGRLVGKKFRKNGTKIFYTAHGFHFYKGAPIKNWLFYYPIEKIMSKYTDVLLTINNEDYELSVKKFKKCKQFLYINGVGVDETKFNKKINDTLKTKYFKELDIMDTDFIITCIGELNSNKNQILAIEAMRQLIKRNKNIKLWLLGNGPYKQLYENRIQEYKLEKNVKLLGYRRDIVEILKLSHVGLSCSLREGLGLNLIEELISELPIIGVNNRGHNEIIENGENGFLIKNDVNELVEKIEALINNKNLYNKLKANSYKSSKKFWVSKSIEKIKKIYDINDENENHDLISIIVPIYNVEKYIEKCIKSIINQTYSNIEIIIVNDGTKDKSFEICKKIAQEDNRIVLLEKENGGLSSARNAGLEICKGEYIAFVDSDDFISPNYIENLYIAIKYGNYDMVQCNIEVTKDFDYCPKKIVFDAKDLLEISKTEALNNRGYMVSACNKLYCKRILKDFKFKVGFINEDDASYYILVDKSDKIAILKESLYYYYYRNNSITKNNDDIKLDFINIYKDRIDYFKKKDIPELIDGSYNRYCLVLMLKYSLAVGKNINKENRKLFLDEFKYYIPFVFKSSNMRIKDKCMYKTFIISPNIIGKIIYYIRRKKWQ